MSDAVKKRLLDVLLACQKIRSFTEGLDFAGYESNEMVRSAVERQLGIVGEALNIASRDDQTLTERLPDLRRIVSLRNRVIHGYDAVDDEIVWDIVQNKLPHLEVQVTTLLVAE